MSSILTNASALSAVSNLNATQKSLATVQSQISTGLKVSTAEDNAAYFSIANTLRTNIANLGAVSDSLNLGKSVVGTANAAISNIKDTLTSFQGLLISASQPSVDRNAVATQIASLQTQLTQSVSTASFNGINLLDGTQGVTGITGAPNPTDKFLVFVSGVTGSGATTAVSSLYVDTSETDLSNSGALADVAAIALTNATTSTELATYITQVGAALAAINTASSTLGAVASTIDQQATFTSSLSDSLTTGVGSLVDADLNEASTRLSALQTQQQLGVQSLSVANQNSQILLKLFQ